MPFAVVPFLLLVIPIIEIGAFIAIGGQIGIAATLLMILVTAIIGTMLLRYQGFQLLNKIRSEFNNGKMPARALGDGAMIVVAGILLLTPGFVTDAIGFSLFVPFIRSTIWSFISKRVSIVMPGGASFQNNHFEEHPRHNGDDTIIDLDDDEYSTGEKSKNSPWNNKHNDQ